MNKVSLSSFFLTDPPTFTLIGETSGGPPTTYTWTRNGALINDGGPFSISLSLNESNPRRFRDSLYVSTLTVTGRYPGVYEYSVTNRANTLSVPINRSSILFPLPLIRTVITIEGTELEG